MVSKILGRVLTMRGSICVCEKFGDRASPRTIRYVLGLDTERPMIFRVSYASNSENSAQT